MMYTTVAKMSAHLPSRPSFQKFLRDSGRSGVEDDDDLVGIDEVLRYAGLEAALWALRAVDGPPATEKAIKMLGIEYGRSVEHLLIDPRIKGTLDVAERHVNGQVTYDELKRAQVQAELLAVQANKDDHMTAGASAAWSAWKAVVFIVVDAEEAAADALSSSTGEALDKVRKRHTELLLAMLQRVEDDEWSVGIPGENEALDLP
jgi:hypothetical protein